jgi:plasmid stabilization system protein ParE
MAFKAVFADDAERDLDLIFAFLVESQIAFGEAPGDAVEGALKRAEANRADAETIARAPYRGTLDEGLLPSLRHVTINRAIFYFDVDEGRQEVLILAVFFGGQEHRRRMLERLL